MEIYELTLRSFFYKDTCIKVQTYRCDNFESPQYIKNQISNSEGCLVSAITIYNY